MNSLPELEERMIVPASTGFEATTAVFDIDLARQRATLHETIPSTIAEARARGYAKGWAEGHHAAQAATREALERGGIERAKADARRGERVERAITALATAANKLDQRAAPVLEEIEQTIVSTAFALAEAILDRELAIATDPGLEAMARALKLAPANRPVTVRLHPGDLVALAAPAGGAGPHEIEGRSVTFVGDPSLRPGDAIAHCDATTFDARLREALDRAKEAFLG